MELSPPSKKVKRCVQSKLSWFASPRVNGISLQSPPLSPAAMERMVEKGLKNLEELKCPGIHKRNSRRSLNLAFEEESPLINAGKHAHPVSSSLKATRRPTEKCQFCTGMQSNYPDLDGDFSVSLPPVHVFDALNDNAVMPDWKNWKFLETKSDNNSYFSNFENFSSLFDGSVKPLKLESTCMNEKKIDLLLLSHEKMGPTTGATSSKLFDSLASEQLSPLFDPVHVDNSFMLPPVYISYGDKMDQNGLHKRAASYHERISCIPDCRLWTEKYKPENALEVCGNAESVSFLGEWIKSWYENGTVKRSVCSSVEIMDVTSYNNEHSMDKSNGGNALKNALLITGPLGFGKSAAVYACAKEQGFNVIEVNASSLRNGAYLRHTFGDAVDSLGLIHWLAKDQVHQTSNPMLELLSDQPNVVNNEVQVEPIEMNSAICNQMDVVEKNSTSGQVANKTLLLFEEVDIVFNEDHGFISTILKLAEITKRPIILTSNKRKPLLPHILNRLVVLQFKAPSLQELVSYISMVCTFEKVHISCSLLEHIINTCLFDIRRILMLLQFWCQGTRVDTDRRNQCTQISVPFDIDAVHLTIPELIPWDFRCELSEKLVEEISIMTSAANENHLHMSIDTQHGPCCINNSFTTEHCMEELHCQPSLHDQKAFSHLDDSYSSILSSQGSLLQQNSFVLSSPSNCYNLPNNPISLISQTRELPELPSAQIEKSFDIFEGASSCHVFDTYSIDDVSCVPQSTLFYGDDANAASYFQSGVASYRQESSSFFHPLDSTCTFSFKSVQGKEDFMDFHNEVKYPSSLSQLMLNEECSLTGFNVWTDPKCKTSCYQEVSLVPRQWRKFRCFRDKYKLFLSANAKYASSATSITSKLADLISETDLIQGSCNTALSESLGPSDTFHTEYGSISCYDKQLDMGYAFTQQAFCIYLMKCATYGSLFGCNSTANFAEKILSTSKNSIALGRLLTQEICSGQVSSPNSLDVKAPEFGTLLGRAPIISAEFGSIVSRLVPIRLSMVLKGLAFHEYLSFTMHISKLATSLAVESWDRKKPKRRSCLHHLRSCAGHFTPEQIELFAGRCCFTGRSSA